MEAIRRMLLDEVMSPLRKLNYSGTDFGKLFKMCITLRKESDTEYSKLKPDFIMVGSC